MSNPDTTLREFFDGNVKLARTMFAAQHEIYLMFIGEDAAGKRYAVVVPDANDSRVKEAAAASLKGFYADKGVVRYAMISEAWFKTMPADTPRDQLPTGSLADDPDRVEVVVVNAFDGERAIHCHMPIIRKPDLDATLGEPTTWEETTTESEGRFTDLVPRQTWGLPMNPHSRLFPVLNVDVIRIERASLSQRTTYPMPPPKRRVP